MLGKCPWHFQLHTIAATVPNCNVISEAANQASAELQNQRGGVKSERPNSNRTTANRPLADQARLPAVLTIESENSVNSNSHVLGSGSI